MQKRIIRPGVLGSPGFRPGGRRPGVRRPGAARPRPLAKIPTKLAQAGFKAANPTMIAQLQKTLANRYPGARPGGRRPGGAGMGLGAMLGQLDRVPGGMSPGPMGRPTGMRPGSRDPGFYASLGRDRTDMADRVNLTKNLRGGTAATGGRPPQTGGNPFAGQQNLRGMFAEGGEVLKTPIDKLPNKGLKKLAKSPKGRKAVARMGFRNGGMAKGGKCPSRGTIRGTGAAIRGVGFKGIK
tara:strand:+ start:587 stop:1303 length:717 start_codon:yes stop_codon:yes gene_type:complete